MRVGFYECDVTPPLGCGIPGYANFHSGQDVVDRLYVKAIVVESQETISAIVAIDACVMDNDIYDAVVKRVSEYTPIKPENICVHANHTHKGLPISDFSEFELKKDKEFTDVLYRKTADAIILAYKRLSDDITISYDTAVVSGFNHNRISILPDGSSKTWVSNKDVEVRPLNGFNDTLFIMSFKSGDKLLGCITSYSQHQDCVGKSWIYSGDFSSTFSQELRNKYGVGFVNVFLLAPCGDVNCVNHDKSLDIDYFHYHKVIGSSLAKATIEKIDNAKYYKNDALKVVEKSYTFPKRTFDTEDEILKEFDRCFDAIGSTLAVGRLIHYLACDNKGELNLRFKAMLIGDVCISFMPGEVFQSAINTIIEKSPFEKMIVVENCNSKCGYVASENAYHEKGMSYETTISTYTNVQKGAFEKFIDISLELVNELK